ncbi:MAG: hypothetical protein EP343_33415 [Deltaproteobacteria bacterium]|nr:MAG: hypothetical protein EP343_33415 [Deltaproteobacteria bacterium]
MSQHNHSGRGPNFGVQPGPSSPQQRSIPQFDDATRPHVDLDSTVDIPPDMPVQDLHDEETINLGPSRLGRPSSSPPTPSPRQQSSIGPDEPSQTLATEAPSSAYLSDASGPLASPSAPITREVGPSVPPSASVEPTPSAKPVDPNALPWWALWRKWKQAQKRRKQTSQTGELPAFQWDVKTMPAGALPPKKAPPPQPQAPKPEAPASVPKPKAPRESSTSAWYKGLWLSLWLGLTVAYSLPLWLSSSFPMSNAPAQLGLHHYVSHHAKTGTSTFASETLAYGGKLGDVFLSTWMSLLPESVALSLWLQLSFLLTVLALGWLLHVTQRPRWNLLLAFPLLYSQALFATDLTFLLALPFTLLGLGLLYSWLVHNQSMHGLLVLVLTWLLLFLHPEAYMLFFLVTLTACFLLGRSWGERLSNMALPATSLLASLPWLYAMLQRFKPGPAAQKTMAAALPERMTQAWSSLTLPTHDGWGSIAAIALFATFWLGVSLAKEEHSTGKNFGGQLFFPVLAWVMLVVFFIVPERWGSYQFATTTPLVLGSFLCVGWLNVRPNTTLGAIVLLAGVTLSGSYGYHTIRSHQAFQEEANRLQTILERLPNQKRLLVWSPPSSRVFKMKYHQAGGYYMMYKEGLSNIDLRSQLKWGGLTYASKASLPSPTRWRTPSLSQWDYVLTGRTPPAHWQPHLRLTLRSGTFRIYRKVKAKPQPRPEQRPTNPNKKKDEDEE